MDEQERDARIERRRQVVRLIKAMADQADDVDSRVQALADDPDRVRVVGALAVAGSTLAQALGSSGKRSVDQILDELEEQMASAPTE